MSRHPWAGVTSGRSRSSKAHTDCEHRGPVRCRRGEGWHGEAPGVTYAKVDADQCLDTAPPSCALHAPRWEHMNGAGPAGFPVRAMQMSPQVAIEKSSTRLVGRQRPD